MKERALWAEYDAAYEDCVNATATEHAPGMCSRRMTVVHPLSGQRDSPGHADGDEARVPAPERHGDGAGAQREGGAGKRK